MNDSSPTYRDNHNTQYRKMNGFDDCMHIDEMEIDFEQSSNDVFLSSQGNVMTWLQNDAPHDILPKVFSFLGPQKHYALSRVNKKWREICLADGVFRTLCEDYGKWEEGRDREPMSCDRQMDLGEKDPNAFISWRDIYCSNPIVPLDYPTIQAAIDATGSYNEFKRTYYFKKSVRILLNPGIHIIEKCMRVHNYGNLQFSVETLEPKFQRCIYQQNSYSNHNYLPFSSTSNSENDGNSNSTSESPPTVRRGNFRQVFNCRSGLPDNTSDGSDESLLSHLSVSNSMSSDSELPSPHGPINKAMLVSKTRSQNTPIFHVTQGTLKIRNLAMIHNCSGIDIWNGNTAVQVQPHIVDNRPMMPQRGDKIPNAILEESDITSISGRGIVAIDGGLATIKKCRVFNCAATGIYVGGPGSAASVLESDIVGNGNGNERNRRGIARGHSGVYLEQGIASLVNCNISRNSLTGISAISHTNATLTVKDSDLVGNGSVQLELPPEGSISRQRSSSENNTISNRGEGRSRVGHDLEGESDGDEGVANSSLQDVVERERGEVLP